MDLDKIRELLAIVAESGVAEVEVESDDFKLTVRKQAPTVTMQPPMPPAFPMPYPAFPMAPPAMPAAPTAFIAPAVPAPAAAAPEAGPAAAEAPATAAPAEAPVKGQPVNAPIVGTFYRKPNPDADPFVEVGTQVKKGDVLCIIEAMKLMNEIEAEFAGTVTQILVDDANPVEYDQPLFMIDPS